MEGGVGIVGVRAFSFEDGINENEKRPNRKNLDTVALFLKNMQLNFDFNKMHIRLIAILVSAH